MLAALEGPRFYHAAMSVRRSHALSTLDIFPILTFHRIVGEPGPALWSDTPVETFRFFMEWLARRGYKGSSLGEAWDARDAATGRRAPGQVAITFDDGYPSTLDIAAPILSRLGFGATVFIPTRKVGRKADFIAAFPERPYWPTLLDWAGVRRLTDHGLEIGSHTLTHPFLDELAAEDEERAFEELATSRDDIARELGAPPRFLCYPYGAFSPTVEALAERAGYEAALTTTPPDGTFSPYRLRRRDDFWGGGSRGPGRWTRCTRFALAHLDAQRSPI